MNKSDTSRDSDETIPEIPIVEHLDSKINSIERDEPEDYNNEIDSSSDSNEDIESFSRCNSLTELS